MTRSKLVLATALTLLLGLSLVPTPALAGDADAAATTAAHVELDAPDNGIVALLGPQIGALGPPTALKINAQYWHRLLDGLAFHASAAMTFGGEASWTSSHPDTPDARYDSTVGGELQAGVRVAVFDFAELPFETYVRGALALDLTGGEELIGYMFGPAAAMGLSYPLMPGLDLVADAEMGLGFGQYKAEGGVFALTFDLLVGAQMAF